jgi:hypothetical protein
MCWWRKLSRQSYSGVIVAVAIVLLAIFLLLRTIFLFNVVLFARESLIVAEAIILGSLGLVTVCFLELRARRAGGHLGSSAYFVAGFLADLLSFGIIESIWILANSFFVIDPPSNVIGGCLVFFGIIIVPIIEGRVWKHKKNGYWGGVLLSFAVLSIMAFFYALQFVGSNPV